LTRSLLIVGPEHSGKTVVAFGLLKALSKRGLKACYMKPVTVSEGERPDFDVLAVKQALGIQEPAEVLCPVALPRKFVEPGEAESALERASSALFELSKKYDVVVAEWARGPEFLSGAGASAPKFARRAGSAPILVLSLKREASLETVVDRAALYKAFFEQGGSALAGVVLNAVPPALLEAAKREAAPAIEALGAKVLGVLEERPELLAPTVEAVASFVGAQILAGARGLGNFVEEVVIGAMGPERVAKCLRRAKGAAFITTGDRAELVAQVLELAPSAVVVADGIPPPAPLLARAEQLGIPILLSDKSVLEVAEAVSRATGVVTSESLAARGEALLSMLEKSVDVDALVAALRAAGEKGISS